MLEILCLPRGGREGRKMKATSGKKYILSFDSGTTSVRCILFDRQGSVRAMAQHEFTQIFPRAGWVEHDPEEIWRMQLLCAGEAMENCGAAASEIAAIGITNQRETTVVWDRKTGKPVYNAIVWQCRRCAPYCNSLKEDGMSELIKSKTGLLPDAYFSAPKIRWILENVPGARERTERGELCFGTVDSWLIWKLCGGTHVTDASNASRTMLFNIHTMRWDSELCSLFGIPESMLPEVKPSSCIYGTTDPALLGGAIPVAGAAGDQQSALFGQTCFEAGDVKNTYGTGCFMLMNTGDEPVDSKAGLVTTVAWSLGDEKVTYALEGSVFAAGAAVQWLRDGTGLIGSSAESESVAAQVPDTDGCYFVPAFTGLGAPYWSQEARGILCGITRGTNRSHIVRAVLESMAYQSYDVLCAMEKDSGLSLSALRVDGGACANDLLMQFQADIAGIDVIRPASVETTALGAAFLAGLAVGFWSDTKELSKIAASGGTSVFESNMSKGRREELLCGWHDAVARAVLQ